MKAQSHLEVVYDPTNRSEKKVAKATRSLLLRLLDEAGMDGSWELHDSKQITKRGRERFGAVRIESRGGVKSIRVWCKPGGNDTAFEHSLVPPHHSDIHMAFDVLNRVNPVTLEVVESPSLPAAVMARAMDFPSVLPPRSRVVEIAPDPTVVGSGENCDLVGKTVTEASGSLLPETAINRIKEMIARYEEATRQVSEIDGVIRPLDIEIASLKGQIESVSEEEREALDLLESLKARKAEVEGKLKAKEKERSDWDKARLSHSADIGRIGPILSSIGLVG